MDLKKLEEYSKAELLEELEQARAQYGAYRALKLQLNMARGKPGSEQLDLSMKLFDPLSCYTAEDGLDVRNYGVLDGLPECKRLFSELLDIPADQLIIGGNASLNLMFDTVASHCLFGTVGEESWMRCALLEEPVKFLCPSPGYDRHFAICEELGIQMIPIPLNSDGPDMETVKELAGKDPAVKGIWCVPLHSNPQGVCYSDAVVQELVTMKTAAPDFRIFWDNAYGVHHIYEKVALKNIMKEAAKYGTADRVYYFFSTSKITFPGAGIAVMASGQRNIAEIKKHMSAQMIGHDKINQLRHVQYFKSAEGIHRQMDRLADLLRPKFDMVLVKLKEHLEDTGLAKWSRPRGGYFVSLDTLPGCAKRTVALAKEAGVVLTDAGATYPYGKDPHDSNIRIAPSYPRVEELEKAMEIFVLCVKIAGMEKILASR